MGRRSPLGVAEALLHFQWLIGKLVDTAAATTANVPLLLSGRFQAETCLRYQAHYSVLLAKTMFCAEGKSMRLPSQAIGDYHDDHTQDVRGSVGAIGVREQSCYVSTDQHKFLLASSHLLCDL